MTAAEAVRAFLWERLEMSKWIRGEAVAPVDLDAIRAAARTELIDGQEGGE